MHTVASKVFSCHKVSSVAVAAVAAAAVAAGAAEMVGHSEVRL